MNPYRHNRLVIVGLMSLAVMISLRHFFLDTDSPYTSVAPAPQVTALTVGVSQERPAFPAFDHELEQEIIEQTAHTVREISDNLAELLGQKEYGLVRHTLLKKAAQAVADGNKTQLGHVLSLLGQLSIEEQDLDTAEVYLFESLDVYRGLNDSVGEAEVYMQLGRMHLKSRELARQAGDAYDRLLVARWQLSEGQHAAAEQNLKHVVDVSLSANRFGSAASAYNSLVELYTKMNSIYQAQQAAMEAATLFAASGQIRRARRSLERLKHAGVEGWRLYDIEQQINAKFAEFEDNVHQIERAKDYRQLYYHYRSQGNEDRAWKLRLLASKSLKNVSRRAMYHRQPDALALLYVSNDAVGRAKDYLAIAQQTFERKGLEELSSQTEKLKEQIF